MRVVSRFDIREAFRDSGASERCPKCSETFRDFIEVSEILWGCFYCGTVFLPKIVRLKELANKKRQLEKQDTEKKAQELAAEMKEAAEAAREAAKTTEKAPLSCVVCGFTAKNKAGLVAHTRQKHAL